MIFDLTKKKLISVQPFCALSVADRTRGMIGRTFQAFDAMIFPHCSAIHSCFMREAIDVVFLARDNRILKLREFFPPWRLCLRCASAATVIELPGGTIRRVGMECADLLDLNAELSSESQKILSEKETGILPASGMEANLREPGKMSASTAKRSRPRVSTGICAEEQ